MKLVKPLLWTVAAYALLVVLFESWLGYQQPESADTLSITTYDADGEPSSRVLSRLTVDGKLYLAANHWPRAWYNEALANPKVQLTMDGQTANYLAAPIPHSEYQRVNAASPLPFLIRFLTGFPPREILRMEPEPAGSAPNAS